MTVPREVLDADPGLGAWCVLHGYRGSIAHGTYEPSTEPGSIDDKDTMAVCVPTHSYYFGLREYGSRGTREIKRGEWDVVVYEARKMIRLLAQGNPNVLSLLWLPERYYIHVEPAGRLLIDRRAVFAGRHVFRSFVGYARGQFYKMEHGATEGYMGEKRRGLVERYGYDTKNAAHLVRILRMGIEFLRDGELYVDRGGFDAAELLAIKHGEWPLEKVKDQAERLFGWAEDAYQRSTLPPRPDEDAVGALCVEVVEAALADRSVLS